MPSSRTGCSTPLIGELCLALLLGTGPVSGEEMRAMAGRAVGEEGFRESRTGEPPAEQDTGWAIIHTISLCLALGLLAVGGDWFDRSYEPGWVARGGRGVRAPGPFTPRGGS